MKRKYVLAYIDPGSGFTISSTGAWLLAFLLGFFGAFLFFLKNIFRSFKKHKKTVIIGGLLVIITLGLIKLGTQMAKKTTVFDGKIVILGFDGLSPEILEPMMAQGELPHFSRLKAEGAYRRLATTNPAQSPVAWTGFSTGKNPGKSGVFDFIARDPRTYRLTLSFSDIENGRPERIIKSKCFWEYLSETKIPSCIITCPVTFPPDKIYGRMLSGMGVPDILGTEGTFTLYTTGDPGKKTGGKIFQITKSPVMAMQLIGPRVASAGRAADNIKVPFKVTLSGDKESALVEYQNHKLELRKGRWSDWQEVTFRLGWFKAMRGIFKFYLSETEPEFKLYVGPINFDPRDPFFPLSYPEDYSRELARKIGLYHTQGMPADTWAVNEGVLSEDQLLEQLTELLKEKQAMLDFELKRFQQGLLFCYFGSSDTLQHMFWRYTDPRHPLYDINAREEYKTTIKSWYKKLDNILGGVMAGMNKEDTLIVLSDHGFGTYRRAVHINSWLRENGYLQLKDPSAESGAELLEDIDWSKTKAYAIGFGAIYINQQGREGEGIVRPGEETELLKAELSRKLKEWRDEKYNQLMVNDVYPREKIFWGAYADSAPDLYIGFHIGYRASWQTALGAVPADLTEDNLKKWSGDHLFDPHLVPGVLFSNKSIKKENPSIYDLTPTILHAAGYEQEKIQAGDFDGEPLF